MMLTYFLFRNGVCKDHMFIIALYTGIGAILGHNFPFYMNFKGGKGIAASAGLIFALAFLTGSFSIRFLYVFIALIITKYVSFSSLCLMTGFLLNLLFGGSLVWCITLKARIKWKHIFLLDF